MATVTVTCAASLDQPRALPNGAVTAKPFASGNVTWGGATDVMLLAKLPNRATILSIQGDVQCAATSVQGTIVIAEVLASGTLSSRALLCSLSAITAGGPIATGRFYPQQVSLSDDAAVQHAMLAMIASGGTQSTSFSIKGVVLLEVTD